MSALRLTDLSKPQWDAALAAARQLTSGHPDNADDRAAFRAAKARMVELLPSDANASEIIAAAVRWNSLNSIAGALAGMPHISLSTGSRARPTTASGVSR